MIRYDYDYDDIVRYLAIFLLSISFVVVPLFRMHHHYHIISLSWQSVFQKSPHIIPSATLFNSSIASYNHSFHFTSSTIISFISVLSYQYSNWITWHESLIWRHHHHHYIVHHYYHHMVVIHDHYYSRVITIKQPLLLNKYIIIMPIYMAIWPYMLRSSLVLMCYLYVVWYQ